MSNTESMTIQESSANLPSTAVEQPVYMQFLPIIFIFGIFYFLLIRPQMKKQKEQQAMINAVKKGDRIILAGGVVGTYLKELDADMVEIEIAKDVKIQAIKSSISATIPEVKTPKEEKEAKKTTANKK